MTDSVSTVFNFSFSEKFKNLPGGELLVDGAGHGDPAVLCVVAGGGLHHAVGHRGGGGGGVRHHTVRHQHRAQRILVPPRRAQAQGRAHQLAEVDHALVRPGNIRWRYLVTDKQIIMTSLPDNELHCLSKAIETALVIIQIYLILFG